MRNEYDFSNGVRGKLYNPSAKKNVPVYLDTEVLDYFEEKAKSKGIELDTLVNDTLKKDIDLIKAIVE